MNDRRDKIDKMLRLFEKASYCSINLGLSRVSHSLKCLGIEEKNMPPIIHIAGTNGKGSTLAFLKAIFEEHGKTIHRYTSPHIYSWSERIECASALITEDALLDTLEYIWQYNQEQINKNQSLSVFEALTVCAFYHFANTKADILLLETGLGGRLDATNVIENPLLSIISPIDYDHQEFLGPTLIDIAREKAGIIKHKRPILSAAQPEEAMDVLKDIAHLKEAPFYEVTFIEDYFSVYPTLMNTEFELNLQGFHQRQNAKTAVACLSLLKEYFSFERSKILSGLQKATWKGRLDHFYLATNNIQQELWIDGAHNGHSARALTHFFKEPLNAIIGIKKRKNAMSFLSTLKPILKQVIFVPVIEGDGPSHTPLELGEIAEHLHISSSHALNLENVLQPLLSGAPPPTSFNSGPILITGSLFLVSQAHKILENKAS